MRNTGEPADPIAAQAGIVAGQSAFDAHWVHLPAAQTEATTPAVELGCGQSVEVVHAHPAPVGAVGWLGQLDTPHQFEHHGLVHMLGGIPET
jgi:hypothetical protein